MSICAMPYLGLMVRAKIVGLPVLPTVFVAESQQTGGLVAFYRAAALDERATKYFLWRIGLNKEISYQPEDMYSSRVDRTKLRRMFAEFKEAPDGRIPKHLNDQFADLAKVLSDNFLATQIEVPLIRAGRIWLHWVGHPIQFSDVGKKGPIRTLFIVYSLAVIAGAIAGAFFCTGALRIVSVSALSLIIVRTAFLVNIPISALEVRYLDLLFPALDMIAICALWSIVGQRQSVTSYGIGLVAVADHDSSLRN